MEFVKNKKNAEKGVKQLNDPGDIKRQKVKRKQTKE